MHEQRIPLTSAFHFDLSDPQPHIFGDVQVTLVRSVAFDANTRCIVFRYWLEHTDLQDIARYLLGVLASSDSTAAFIMTNAFPAESHYADWIRGETGLEVRNPRPEIGGATTLPEIFHSWFQSAFESSTPAFYARDLNELNDIAGRASSELMKRRVHRGCSHVA